MLRTYSVQTRKIVVRGFVVYRHTLRGIRIGRQTVCRVGRKQHNGASESRQYLFSALGGMRRIERHVKTAGIRATEKRGEHLHALRSQNSHRRPRRYRAQNIKRGFFCSADKIGIRDRNAFVGRTCRCRKSVYRSRYPLPHTRLSRTLQNRDRVACNPLCAHRNSICTPYYICS